VGLEPPEPEDIQPIEELNWELKHIRFQQQKEASRAAANEANQAVPNEPNAAQPELLAPAPVPAAHTTSTRPNEPTAAPGAPSTPHLPEDPASAPQPDLCPPGV
jgi:hypothetical protein